MNQNAELFRSVQGAAQMGIESIELLLDKTEHEGIRTEMLHQLSEYKKSEQKALEGLKEAGEKPKMRNPLTRAGTWMGIQMDTLVDQSPSHLADMLIQGSTMGVIELTRARAACPDAGEKAHKLASDFLQNEDQAIDRLKNFL
ncbi:MAG: hypothetical protein IJC48_04360 [Clostridia bacterium]|nr:hypothetical protein [Clostridia bacterium]